MPSPAEIARFRERGGWAPQPGSQAAFLACPIFEVLYEGTRGPGKTDSLLMDFAQHCNKGFGAEWRGVLFRQTYPQLSDVIAKTQKWFRIMFPEARFIKTPPTWTWPGGEQLLLRHMDDPSDYWNYHGHAYPWIGFEELTNWPTDECYIVMMSCSRSTRPDMPRKFRATANAYGVGHNWVKRRFQLPRSRGRVITEMQPIVRPDGTTVERPMHRVAIHGSIYENRILLEAEPDYIQKIKMAARNPQEEKAWLEGDWDIVSGGMFDDLWRWDVHMVPNFPIRLIPASWRIDRAFDWGSSKPFSVGWYAESSGEPIEWEGRKLGTVRGDVIRFAEWYGWNGTRNEGVRMMARDIALGILDREEDMGLAGRVRRGIADSSIFNKENGNCISDDMKTVGVMWQPADKSPGSRKQGWEQIRKALKGSLPRPRGEPREDPGLFVCHRCEQWAETVPMLPRSEKDPDDVNTDAEDHAGDETRYRVRRKIAQARRRSFNA